MVDGYACLHDRWLSVPGPIDVTASRASTARRLARSAFERGEATAWFEELYEAADRNEAVVPWDEQAPNPHLLTHLERGGAAGWGSRVVVVGCGYGDDAEFLSSLGYEVTAFDLSQSAIAAARRRFPATTVDYVVADLFDCPVHWRGGFDVVFEAYTVQVHQGRYRVAAAEAIASLVADGGVLFVVAHARGAGDPTGELPWPLTLSEIESFVDDELQLVNIARAYDDLPAGPRWVAEFERRGRTAAGRETGARFAGFPTGEAPLWGAGAVDEGARTAAAIPRDVAERHAAEVDRRARFPAASLTALADSGLLAAAAPTFLGGAGLNLATQAAVGVELGRACGSSAMVWAMHQLQLACILRHGADENSALADIVGRAAAADGLIASVTSEVGNSDMMVSSAPATADGGQIRISKRASMISYAEQAGFFLVTARRDPHAKPEEQAVVIADRSCVRLTPTGVWNALGMRGTCSRPYDLVAEAGAERLLRDPFRDVASQTLIPLSQILWSSVWLGLAQAALARAVDYLDRSGDPPIEARSQLVRADQQLLVLEAQIRDGIALFEAAQGDGRAREERGLRRQLVALKLAASTVTVEVCQHALSICGLAGYQEAGRFSVARPLRDLYSARVMISNNRLLEVQEFSVSRVRGSR